MRSLRYTVGMVLLGLGAVLPASAQQLDAYFVADRVLVDLPLAAGGHLRFWSDTGGGTTILHSSVASRLGLRTTPLDEPDVGPDAGSLVGAVPMAATAFPQVPGPVIVMKPNSQSLGWPVDSDGNLGQNWFSGHVWTWDYPKGTLVVEPDDWQPHAHAHEIALGFKTWSAGQRPEAFARITVTIAGKPYAMLLDTGATTALSPSAVKIIGKPVLRATSMIVASHLQAWHQQHPDWPYIVHGQLGTGSNMLRIPDVRIAGFEVGPVWFTERPDVNFHKGMSSAMDATVEGAIGGNAFHSLRMTIDYPHHRAYFSRG